MSSLITDKAEVSIDFLEKFFMGSLSRGSSYNVRADAEGIHIYLDRQQGEKRHVGFHIHYYLLADLLEASADAVKAVDKLDRHHKQRLKGAAERWLKIDE